ncbi:hypothetical protein X801_00167, partial [Opisthorchis viverrini]
KPQYLITKKHKDSLRELRARDDLIISRPDKGNGIVVMNKTDYIRKMTDILADTTKFSQTANDKDKNACNRATTGGIQPTKKSNPQGQQRLAYTACRKSINPAAR